MICADLAWEAGDLLILEGVLRVEFKASTLPKLQEARALRFLAVAAPAAARHIVSLRAAFSFKGHFVLVGLSTVLNTMPCSH